MFISKISHDFYYIDKMTNFTPVLGKNILKYSQVFYWTVYAEEMQYSRRKKHNKFLANFHVIFLLMFFSLYYLLSSSWWDDELLYRFSKFCLSIWTHYNEIILCMTHLWREFPPWLVCCFLNLQVQNTWNDVLLVIV